MRDYTPQPYESFTTSLLVCVCGHIIRYDISIYWNMVQGAGTDFSQE